MLVTIESYINLFTQVIGLSRKNSKIKMRTNQYFQQRKKIILLCDQSCTNRNLNKPSKYRCWKKLYKLDVSPSLLYLSNSLQNGGQRGHGGNPLLFLQILINDADISKTRV